MLESQDLSSQPARLAIGFAASLALHVALLLALDPGSAFFARARAPGKSSDTRLLATLAAPQQQVRPDSVAAILNTEDSSSALAKSDMASIAPAKSGRRNAVENMGIQGATGDQAAYFSEKELDVRPVPVGDIVPDSPDFTGTVKGLVLLRLQINREGTVDRVIVVKAVPDHSFRPGTFWAFERARFIPAQRRGIPVNSELLIELRYGAEGGEPPLPAANSGH
jgi:hypothetical protein